MHHFASLFSHLSQGMVTVLVSDSSARARTCRYGMCTCPVHTQAGRTGYRHWRSSCYLKPVPVGGIGTGKRTPAATCSRADAR